MNENKMRGLGEVAIASPPQNKEAPAGRHGAISGEKTNAIYRHIQMEAIRFARVALSLSEFEEWINKMEVINEPQ